MPSGMPKIMVSKPPMFSSSLVLDLLTVLPFAAYFGLLAFLGDKQFKLSTEASNGQLVRTTATYPRRMVNALRSLPRCKDRGQRARDPACKGFAERRGVVGNV